MTATAAATIWDRERLGITIGTVVLIFLAAIEALAVTTVMPVVADDLNGEDLFAVAFSATLATGVIGMVAVGAWSDRAGPRAPLYTAVALFAVGLLVSGFALDMHPSSSDGSSRVSERAGRPSHCTSWSPGSTRLACTGPSSPLTRPPGWCPRWSVRSSPVR